MRVFITGGTGFIGGAVVRRLIARGDQVVAMVRNPDRAGHLGELGVEVRQGDLTRIPLIVDAMRGADAGVHLAGDYRVGIPAQERPEMFDANVGSTSRVVEAARTARLERLVYASTANVLGDTHGRIVDERHRRDLGEGFLSTYDETKFLAHRAVEEQMAAGVPILIVMPGVTYGPGDHSSVGEQLREAYHGRLTYVAFGDMGMSAVHVDDVASGIVAALDRGRIGESYILAGENVRLRDGVVAAARAGGHRPPRLTMPSALIDLAAAGPRAVRDAMGLPADLREVIRAGRGVTYWVSSAKAAAELGYGPRDLHSGLRAAFEDG